MTGPGLRASRHLLNLLRRHRWASGYLLLVAVAVAEAILILTGGR